MAKWTIYTQDGVRTFVTDGAVTLRVVCREDAQEIARKLNAFDGMLEALKAILTNPASAIAHSDLERALVVIAKVERE